MYHFTETNLAGSVWEEGRREREGKGGGERREREGGGERREREGE